MLYLERAIEMLHGYLFSAFSLFFSVISLLSAYPQAFRLGACNVSGICPFMPCAPVDPNYRESILRVFDDHLRPFVRESRRVYLMLHRLMRCSAMWCASFS